MRRYWHNIKRHPLLHHWKSLKFCSSLPAEGATTDTKQVLELEQWAASNETTFNPKWIFFWMILATYPVRKGVGFLARPSKWISRRPFKSKFDANENEKQSMENIRQSSNNSSNQFLRCMMKYGAKEHCSVVWKYSGMGTHKIQMTMTQWLTELHFYCERILIASPRLAFGSLFKSRSIPPYCLRCHH